MTKESVYIKKGIQWKKTPLLYVLELYAPAYF